jgi:hypothetical protein
LTLEDLRPDASVRGVLPDAAVTVVSVQWHELDALTLVYRGPGGRVADDILVVCPGSLAEQWQVELHRRFHLPFEILTNDRLEAARTGNWFLENDLAIAARQALAQRGRAAEARRAGLPVRPRGLRRGVQAVLVNLQRIHGYNSVNLRKGYPMIEIRTPREVLSDG